MKKILIREDNPCLQKLAGLISQQPRKTLVAWVLDCSQRTVALFEERCPGDPRPRKALEAADEWAHGRIKMPEARQAALASHRAATDIGDSDPAARAAARAMGHVVGTVHVGTHAMGYVLYAITAVAYAEGVGDLSKIAARESDTMYRRLEYWVGRINELESTWNSFLEKDANKRR